MAGVPISVITGEGVPSSRTITINGVTYDLSQNRSWSVGGGGGGGTGTVTSVALTTPTGLTVSGSPITTSGTLSINLASGYSIPTTVKQSNWDDAYTFVGLFPTQTGNSGKFLTTNGSALSWATISGSGTVTSVGLSVPTGLSISGSPITTSGTLAVTFTSGYSIPLDTSQTNWNTAYGWGNHASAGYLTTSAAATTYVPKTRTITINGTSYDLSADRSWTISASATAGGSDKQVQYNSGGAIAGATNVEIVNGNLTLVDTATPTTPSANRIALYSDAMATRQMVASVTPDGTTFDFQSAIFTQTTFMWLPSTGTTVGINWGTSWTARNSGTSAAQSTPAISSTDAISSMVRSLFGTGTTATGSSGFQSASQLCWRGNASNLGGFFFVCRFALAARSGTSQLLIGLSALNAALAGEPSAQNSTLAVGFDSTDSNFKFISRSTTAATSYDTTVAINTTTIYDIYIYASPNGSSVTYELRNALTNTTLATQTESTNLPASTTMMYAHAQIRSASGTTAKTLAISKLYLETNL